MPEWDPVEEDRGISPGPPRVANQTEPDPPDVAEGHRVTASCLIGEGGPVMPEDHTNARVQSHHPEEQPTPSHDWFEHRAPEALNAIPPTIGPEHPPECAPAIVIRKAIANRRQRDGRHPAGPPGPRNECGSSPIGNQIFFAYASRM